MLIINGLNAFGVYVQKMDIGNNKINKNKAICSLHLDYSRAKLAADARHRDAAVVVHRKCAVTKQMQ